MVLVIFFLHFGDIPPPSRVVRNRTRVGVKGGGSPPLHVRVCGENVRNFEYEF